MVTNTTNPSPHRECSKEVQFKYFNQHVEAAKCCVNLRDVEDYDFISNYGMSLPYVLSRQVVWDGQSEIKEPMYDRSEDQFWKLMKFNVESLQMSFYLTFNFIASKQSFVISVALADSRREARKYKAKIWMEVLHKEDNVSFEEERVSFVLEVVSVEEHLNLEGYLSNAKYLTIPYEDIKKYFTYHLNDEDDIPDDEKGKYSVSLPIQVEDIFKEG